MDAGISCVDWDKDALACIYRVPAWFIDQQLLVPDGEVVAAAKVICDNFSYSAVDNPQDETIGDGT